MSTREVWRVVLASGEVREVDVYFDESNTRYTDSRYRWCAGGMRGSTPLSAVISAMAVKDWPITEILAPGEPSRAEVRAEVERHRGALDAAMAGAQRLAAEAAELRSERAEVRAAAWREGAEAMRAACVVGAESFDGRLPRGDGSVTALACFNALEARRVIVDAIRNLPLPEVSR